MIRFREKHSHVSLGIPDFWLPWWLRPSSFLGFVMLPFMILFSFSDPTLTLSKAQLFYSSRDCVLGVFALLLMVGSARFAECKSIENVLKKTKNKKQTPRIAEAFLSEKLDYALFAIFLVAHLIFFRGFVTNPGLIAGVLGGNLELKHSFETIPGVTSWTQVSLVIAALRGLRWSGILPGKVKLISWMHIIFFVTLFTRAILWSERLALIEGLIPFFLCALPKIGQLVPRFGRQIINIIPLLMPLALLLVFVAFESLRSWQSVSGSHANIFVFGWKRLFTYYFEAMNTGAATLLVAGFWDGVSMPIFHGTYGDIFKGLYQGSLDKEFNNPSGIWYVATYCGTIFAVPGFIFLGLLSGATYRSFVEGRIFGLFYPIQFLFMFEILRIHYWIGTFRVTAATIVIFGILIWAFLARMRMRPSAPTQQHHTDAGSQNQASQPTHH